MAIVCFILPLQNGLSCGISEHRISAHYIKHCHMPICTDQNPKDHIAFDSSSFRIRVIYRMYVLQKMSSSGGLTDVYSWEITGCARSYRSLLGEAIPVG